jgi:hypothetical protein
MHTITSRLTSGLTSWRRRRARSRAQHRALRTDPTLQPGWGVYNRPGAPANPAWLAAQPADLPTDVAVDAVLAGRR